MAGAAAGWLSSSSQLRSSASRCIILRATTDLAAGWAASGGRATPPSAPAFPPDALEELGDLRELPDAGEGAAGFGRVLEAEPAALVQKHVDQLEGGEEEVDLVGRLGVVGAGRTQGGRQHRPRRHPPPPCMRSEPTRPLESFHSIILIYRTLLYKLLLSSLVSHIRILIGLKWFLSGLHVFFS